MKKLIATVVEGTVFVALPALVGFVAKNETKSLMLNVAGCKDEAEFFANMMKKLTPDESAGTEDATVEEVTYTEV